ASQSLSVDRRRSPVVTTSRYVTKVNRAVKRATNQSGVCSANVLYHLPSCFPSPCSLFATVLVIARLGSRFWCSAIDGCLPLYGGACFRPVAMLCPRIASKTNANSGQYARDIQ